MDSVSVYTTVTVCPVTKIVGSGTSSTLQTVDSTSTIAQTTTLTICTNGTCYVKF